MGNSKPIPERTKLDRPTIFRASSRLIEEADAAALTQRTSRSEYIRRAIALQLWLDVFLLKGGDTAAL